MEPTFATDENSVETVEGLSYEFPYTMHETSLTDFFVPWHWHEELEFNYAYKGNIKIQTTYRTYTVHQGEAFFVNTNVLNTKSRAEDSPEAMEHAHIFHPILLTGHFKSIFETRYLNPILQNQSLELLIIRGDTPAEEHFIRSLLQLSRLSRQEDAAFQIRNLLSDAWMDLMTIVESRKHDGEIDSSRQYLQDRARNMLSYLHSHSSEKITLEDLADELGLSTKECARSFKAVFHKTPQEYLTEYRVEQSRRLLSDTEHSITEIAYETGFGSSAYFGKVFRQYCGVTPREYRKQQRADRAGESEP